MMGAMILKRIGIGFATLLVVSVLVFAGTEILPGDVAQIILGQSATPESLAALRAELGLDQPWYVRYFGWLGDMVTGDLGISKAGGATISSLIGERLLNTFELGGIVAIIAVPLSIILGLIAAMYPGTLPEDPNQLLSIARQGQTAWLDADYNLMRFAPAPLRLKRGDGLPHIRLDKAANFLIGDRLS